MDVLTALGKLFDRFGKECRPSELICSEGEESTDMYFVLEGAVEVVRDAANDGAGQKKRPIVLAKLEVGDFFGEMSLLLSEPRSASVRAAQEGARIVRLSPGNFDTIVKIQPQIALRMLRVLAQRLRDTSDRVAK